MMKIDVSRWLPILLLGCVVAMPVGAADKSSLLSDFEDRTTVHTLENGWTFILVERPVAPVFSFATFVDVGSAQEVPGITGLAHMFEHMAFKGTSRIGTNDYEAEAKALEAVETAYLAYEKARRARGVDPAEVDRLHEVFKEAQAKAGEYVVTNEFVEIVQQEGGVGLNAFTSTDFTGYFYSLPANKIELFAYLESTRFLDPVFREFYKERDVVQEERRQRTDNQPLGRLIEQALAVAFIAHPYKQPVVGYMSDIESFSATDAEAFYRKHYPPANMVTAVVGHIDRETLIPMLEKYFGRVPAGEKPEPLRTVEPPSIAERTVVMEDPSQPMYIEMYHRPSALHPDAVVYDAIDDILSNGRTSRLYRRMVRDEKSALFAGSFSPFPGEKYPALTLAFVVPAQGHDNADVQRSIREELDQLREELVSPAELERFKARARAGLVRQLQSNAGMAQQLAQFHTLYGDWRELFKELDRVEAVTAEDIKRVANELFRPANRIVAEIVTQRDDSTEEASK